MRIDIHQHIWTRPLLDRLAARGTMPLVRASDGVTVLHSAAEQPYVTAVERAAHGPRGPTVDLRDPLTFYETSSYGSAAVDAIVRQVGEAQLAYGSDRPVIEPIATGREAVLQTNGAGLIAPIGVLPYEAVGRRARSAD